VFTGRGVAATSCGAADRVYLKPPDPFRDRRKGSLSASRNADACSCQSASVARSTIRAGFSDDGAKEL
jgi:hypothetical protein